jgi:hypothetical protein
MSTRRVPTTTCPPCGPAGTLHGPAVALKLGRTTEATGSYWSADKGAASEAKYLNEAARAFMSSPEGFAIVEKEMNTILKRVGERDYMGYLRGYREYRDALAYLGHFVLGQSSDADAWYDMKKKVVQFMFQTADQDALRDVRHTMSYSPEGANKFYNALGRFQTAAFARGDAQVFSMAAQMQQSIA